MPFTILERCAEVAISNQIDASELTRRTAGLQIKALHEASAKTEAIDKQCVVVCSNKVVKGNEGGERQVTLGALNGVIGTLTLGGSSARHHLVSGKDVKGVMLLLIKPIVSQGGGHDGKSDRVELYVSEQSQIIEVGIAKQVDTCGATTRAGRPCTQLFDKDRAKFCVFHTQGISRRDVVRSVSYLEQAQQANECHLQALAADNLPGPTGSSTTTSAATQGSSNSLLKGRLGQYSAPSAREQVVQYLRRGTAWRAENLVTSVNNIGQQQQHQQQQQQQQQQAEKEQVVAPFSGRPDGKRVVEAVSSERRAMADAGVAVKPVAMGAAAAADKAKTRGKSSGIGELAALEDLDETPAERALLGTGATKMDGAVAVPSVSSVFRCANERYRQKVAAGASFDTAGAAAAAAAAAGAMQIRRPTQAMGGPVATLNNALRAGGSTVRGGAATATSSLSSTSTSTGPTRAFSSLAKQTGASKALAREQAAVEARRRGALAHQQAKKETGTFNGGLRMVGGVMINENVLNGEAHAISQKMRTAAANKYPADKAAQRLLENQRRRAKNQEDAEIEALLKRKSSHAAEAEDEWMERFQKKMKKLEGQEYYAKKNSEQTSLSVRAFACMQCNLTTEEAPHLCRQKGHRVSTINTTKRFFACKSCGTRANTLGALVPAHRCAQCRCHCWRPGGSRGEFVRESTGGGLGRNLDGNRLVLSGSDYSTRGATDDLTSRAGGLT